MTVRSFAVGVIFLWLGLRPDASQAGPRDTTHGGKLRQLVVTVYQSSKGLRFEVDSGPYKRNEPKDKAEANYFLAELKLHEGGDCQLIEIIDDRSPLSAITEVSEMAINAGFKDIRPFIYWHKTGRMAQVLFGPPIKFSANTARIEQTEKPR